MLVKKTIFRDKLKQSFIRKLFFFIAAYFSLTNLIYSTGLKDNNQKFINYGNINSEKISKTNNQSNSYFTLSDYSVSRIKKTKNFYSQLISGSLDSIKDKEPLVFPNPCKIEDGFEIGFFYEKRNPIEIYIYNMKGHLKVKKTVPTQALSNNSSNVYYIEKINQSDFYAPYISAGAYFFVLVQNEQPIGKGKFGVIP